VAAAVVPGRMVGEAIKSLYGVSLARYGGTAWSPSGQQAGLTDILLTQRGRHDASRLEERLRGPEIGPVFISPLQRPRRTCDLAGSGTEAEVRGNLVVWNYGRYEGVHTTEIHAWRTDWQRRNLSTYLARPADDGGETKPYWQLASVQGLPDPGNEGRMNFPRNADGNWRWRSTEGVFKSSTAVAYVSNLTEPSHRFSGPGTQKDTRAMEAALR
jgi:hypothetical protein